MLNFHFTEQFKKDYKKLRKDKKDVVKLTDFLVDISKTRYTGIGHPEPLKYNMTGSWSRQISQKNRLVYEVVDNVVFLISCIGHYNDK